jgi:putative hemolysin
MTDYFILFGLILVNGLFCMAEMALVSAKRARLEAQANKGDQMARRAFQLTKNPETFLPTVQIGMTLTTLLTGLFSGEKGVTAFENYLRSVPALSQYAHNIATTVVVIVVTFFTLILGELVPKRLGLTAPEAISKIVAGPMKIFNRITYPFVWLLNKVTNMLLRLFRLKPNENMVTEEEIKAIISEGTEHGAIEETEQEIIERVFHLGDRNITSLMTHRHDILWFDLSDNENAIKEKILREPHSVYPICDGTIDKLQGIVSIKDMYVTPDFTPFKEMMKPALFVPENNTPYQLLERFRESKIHTCFVVDEYGTLLGLITLNDILEAIVGELPQHDMQDYDVTLRDDGSFLVDGQIPFYDFLSRFEQTEWMNEGEQEFDTLAGFILHRLERIPKAGDKLDWKGFQFEILDMDGHRIDKILVKISDSIKEGMDD